LLILLLIILKSSAYEKPFLLAESLPNQKIALSSAARLYEPVLACRGYPPASTYWKCWALKANNAWRVK
jgi:hypothetical protein